MPRWLKVTLVLVVSLGVLAGLAEWGLRLIIPNIVSSSLRTELALPKSHPVDVTLGGSALLSAVQGRVGAVEVEIPDAPVVEGVVATLTLKADSVPFSVTEGEIGNPRASVFIASDKLGPVISLLTSGVADTGKTTGDELVVGRTIEAFGFKVPIEARLRLAAEDGKVRIDPTGLSAVGFDLNAEQLAAATGGLLDPLLESRALCVSGSIPAGVTLETIDITERGARVAASLAPDFLSNPTQQELGTCE